MTAALARVKPDKAIVEFGVDVAVEGGGLTALLVKGKGTATLTVTLEWVAGVGEPKVTRRETIPDDLLPRCTVRIDYRDAPSGTGFFVAPSRVVTCAHVIQPEGTRTALNPADVSIRDHAGNRRVVEEVPEIWPGEDPDLAILKVAAGTSHGCVLLDSQVNARDEMHSYGYPMDRDTGVLIDDGGSPTTFDAEGRQGKRGWIKLKEGQAIVDVLLEAQAYHDEDLVNLPWEHLSTSPTRTSTAG